MKFLPCLYAFLACMSFCFIFEIKKPWFILLASAVGALGWAAFLLMEPMGSDVARYLLATVAVSLLSELLARFLKAPATIFLIIGIIPLVPGGGLYYAMEYLINGDFTAFAQKGIQTAAYAGAIAVGVSLVSSLARILRWRNPAARPPEPGDRAL